VAQVPWARHGAGHTRAFDDTVAWLAVQCSKSAVVELLRIAWRSVGAIITRVQADIDAEVDRLDGLRRIGIDEISYKRGHRYLTISWSTTTSAGSCGSLQAATKRHWAASSTCSAQSAALRSLTFRPTQHLGLLGLYADRALKRCSVRTPFTYWPGAAKPSTSSVEKPGTRPAAVGM
jgi:hypothetical protein